ncbi:MAG: type II secretion system secretin GspD [Bryobacteraceae bacterium]
MMRSPLQRALAVWPVIASLLCAQQPAPPPKFTPPPNFALPQYKLPGSRSPAGTPPAKPPAPAVGQPQPGQTPATAPSPVPPPRSGKLGGLNLQNASLPEVIDFLARQLGINYILDSRVKGGVTLNTYGETKEINPRDLLDTVLRINGFGMVQQGNVYRIVPLAELARMPIPAEQANAKDIPSDDKPMLNLVFLKYATVEELAKLLDPFLGPDGKSWAYPPANLLLVLDSRRNMKRLMDLVSLFDNDTFARQRVRLFEVEHGRPSDIAKELEGILKSISLTDKNSPVRFLPINRINTLVAVAPNPGVFDEVERWLKRLDVAVKSKAGAVDNYVYRVRYGRAELLAMGIMQLYMGVNFGMMGMGMGMGGYGMGGMGMGGYGMGGMGMGGMGMGGYGMGGMNGMSGYGMGGMGMGGYGMGGYGGGYGGGMGMGGYGMGQQYTPQYVAPTAAPATGTAASGATSTTTDLTGSYLGSAPAAGGGAYPRIPRVVPNPLDNSLLIQATAEEYEGILKLLRDLDVPPRQVLIEAKIYEVSLTGALSGGVQAFLQRQDAAPPTGFPAAGTRTFQGSNIGATGAALTSGILVGRSRELLASMTAFEDTRKGKIISAPSIIATDSIAATIVVGSEVPTLSSTSVTPIQSGGNSLFANTINNRQSGVTLSVIARVNPSGIVTLVINQEVSAPVPPAASASIQSPSFSKRTVNTQVTVQDGDTIAIGGIIQETDTISSSGIPLLHRIPGIGFAFGSKSNSKERTELIIFMTPRVIYDTNEITEASDELKSQMHRVGKIIR